MKNQGVKMNNKNVFYRIYQRLLAPFYFWRSLNFEAKLGLILLTPPLFGIIIFFSLTTFDFYYYNWGTSGSTIASNTPLYLGLMALAGSYLIKGNINK